MQKSNSLTNYFDAVVMLTWSNWHKELRSNRYHYASRFSRSLPVIFIQPDLTDETYYYEKAELDNLYILHIWSNYEPRQHDLINEALNEKNIIKPLIWVYNVHFYEYLEKKYCPLYIYHATEDYFSIDAPTRFVKDSNVYNIAKSILNKVDLLVSVSEGVNESFCNNGYKNDSIVISNGCDYNFYSKGVTLSKIKENYRKKVIFYQGNIFSKLNYELLDKLTKKMPEWEFWYCGQVVFNEPGWQKLLKNSNVKYLGVLTVEEIRSYAHKATVGIIPFVEQDWIINRSFPLKSFEYLAAGLPVVTVPIKSLLPYENVFYFAKTAKEFKCKIEQAAKERVNKHAFKERLKEAALQDYDLKFDCLLNKINNLFNANGSLTSPPFEGPLKILVLYDINSIHVATIQHHIGSFYKYSKNEVYYLSGTREQECKVDLSVFDVIIIHYSVRLSVDNGNFTLSRSFTQAVRNFAGYKIAFLQDEYETTNTAKNWFKILGIHAVFTCLPENHIHDIYPKEEFPYIDFIPTLTGYVPLNLEKIAELVKPFSERKYYIGYRGRNLPFWYGDLGQEKLNIGINVKNLAMERGIPVDIEWTEDKRIYHNDWFHFLSNCRAVLGTESGSNIFDFDGSIRQNIENVLLENPSLTYDKVFNKYLKQHEGKVKMNQISPKIFEAISLRTALILFEGSYSGVVKPNIHYIPLKKDYSNIEEVFEKILDINYLKQLTDRAYDDIILSQKYSYRNFVQGLDHLLSTKIRKPNQFRLSSDVIDYLAKEGELFRPANTYRKDNDITDYSAEPILLARGNSKIRNWYMSIKKALLQKYRDKKMK